MKVNILNRKLIKPSTPTPPNLKNYNLSCNDKVMPPMDVPIILFYASSPNDNTKKAYLEESLAKILPKFYPFAGRYIAKDHLVDCSDQGVEFIEAQVADHHLELLEFIKEIKYEQLSNLLHQEANSLMSIQVTTFKCGGVVIGVRIFQHLVDGSSVGTFITAWANANNNQKMTINPIFHSPTLFACKNLDIGLGLEELRIPTDLNIVAKMYVFNKEAITSLKAKIRKLGNSMVSQSDSTASRVRVVCAFIAKALMRLDRAKTGQSPSDCLIFQVVNVRERIIPPLPKHSFGNFVTAAQCKGSDNMGFEELVGVLGEATSKSIADCAKIFSGECIHSVLVDPIVNMSNAMASGETNTFLFSYWTKFRFYDADFGWGKPVWTGIETMPLANFTILMDNKEGDGAEAWVHLNHQDMVYFEQDEEIRSFAA